MWVNQVRWVGWDGHYDADPLTDIEALPQGDPFGPLGLNVYMAAGLQKVKKDLEIEEGVERLMQEDVRRKKISERNIKTLRVYG